MGGRGGRKTVGAHPALRPAEPCTVSPAAGAGVRERRGGSAVELTSRAHTDSVGRGRAPESRHWLPPHYIDT